MRKYNKLRGIVRAKQGSRIPKLLLGGTWNIMQLYNQNSIGFDQGQQLPDASDYPLPNLQLPSIDFKPVLPETALLKYFNNLANTTLNDTLGKKQYFSNNFSLTNTTTPGSNLKKFADTKFGKGASKAGNFVGNLITDNSEAIMGIGANIARNSVDILGKGFGKFDRATQGIAAFGKQIGGPVGGVVSAFATGINTWGNVINALGAKRLLNFSVNKDVQSRVGSSYGGSYTDILKAGNLSGKKVGLFGGARNKNNFIDDQRIVQGRIARIDAENLNLQAMAGNDLNYLGYQMQQDGGYDLLLMGMRAKQGGVLLKINLVKSKHLNKDTINLDIKEIELEPIIDDVEKFKEGGVFPSLVDNSSINYPICELEWEPIIDGLADDWEPTIDDIELYREGGKTKEELETPEIEETNQKNLIPEGALHKNKHHMEHAEGLTLKGIPVIDNDGEQLAEIELDEIIFTLEVTKKLEELYKEGTDEAAIEAGKLLVKEILFNTDDRTGLISKCEKGGKL